MCPEANAELAKWGLEIDHETIKVCNETVTCILIF